ncbi:MAG: DNA translocase FtsK 4TM domain-containing protein [Patescibacteria group bacterium]
MNKPVFDDLSPQAKQAIWAVLMGMIAVFFVFSLLNYAGLAGEYVAKTLRALFGAGAWLAPLFCVTYIYVLLSPREDNGVSLSKALGTVLFFVALLGALELYRPQLGGWTGYGIVWPISYLVGSSVTGVLLFGFVLISILLVFNTGLKFPSFKSGAKKSPGETEDEEDELSYLDAAERTEVTSSQEPEREEDQNMVTAAVAKIAKTKPHEIVVKHFSGTYVPPSLSLLNKEVSKANIGDVKANSNMIKRTLNEFGISVEMDAVESGPTITRYALKPAQGVRIARIAGLQQELQLALRANSIRIEAPIPGKSLVGIEVPNQTRATVGLASILATPEYTDSPHPLIVALGKDVTGNVHFANIARMPHGLIAGATGSGKSVAIHNMIVSLLYRNSPDQLRFILVDPKRVELTLYNKIPHLLTPVITDAKKAIRALSWAVKEMERRYDILEAEQVQNLTSYHKNIYQPAKKEWEKTGSKEEERANLPEALPYIVIILDELNDLMQAYPRELEATIVRLAQMSRAVGIHLILATQRPSVNVITGTIKANVPTRIALAVASQIDSRTIIDGIGAEKLLGAGDMLYLSSDSPKPFRLQSAFISEEEIKRVVEYLRKQDAHELDTLNLDETSDSGGDSFFKSLTGADDVEDDLYEDARVAVLEAGKASTSYLQRKLRIGYSRAARLMDLLEENGIIGPADGARPREVLGPGGTDAAISSKRAEADEDAEETDR